MELNHRTYGFKFNQHIKIDIKAFVITIITLAVLLFSSVLIFYLGFSKHHRELLNSAAYETLNNIEELYFQLNENPVNQGYILGEILGLLEKKELALTKEEYDEINRSSESFLQYFSTLVGNEWLKNQEFIVDAIPFLMASDGRTILHPGENNQDFSDRLFYQKLIAKKQAYGYVQHQFPETRRGTNYYLFYKYNPDLDIFTLLDIEESAYKSGLIIIRNKLIMISFFLYIVLALFIYLGYRYIFSKVAYVKSSLDNILHGKEVIFEKGDESSEVGFALKKLQELNQFLKAMAVELKNISSEKNKDKKSEDLRSDYNNILTDSLTEAKLQLSKFREQELERNKENEKQSWIAQGIAKFSDIIRRYNELESMGEHMVSQLSKHLNLNQCGLFAVDIKQTKDTEDSLTLIATYAYDRSRHLKKKIKIGDGPVGECAKEGKSINLKNIPKDYLYITSGLGKATPKHLFLQPLINEEKVVGVIEIATFEPLSSNELEFLDQLGEIIASAISNLLVNENTKKLLQETREQAEQMASQEEEMRQTMEELQATQDEMSRKGKQMEELNLKFKEKEAQLLTQLEEKEIEIKRLKEELKK